MTKLAGNCCNWHLYIRRRRSGEAAFCCSTNSAWCINHCLLSNSTLTHFIQQLEPEKVMTSLVVKHDSCLATSKINSITHNQASGTGRELPQQLLRMLFSYDFNLCYLLYCGALSPSTATMYFPRQKAN